MILYIENPKTLPENYVLIDTNCATFIFSPSIALEKHDHNLEQKASR